MIFLCYLNKKSKTKQTIIQTKQTKQTKLKKKTQNKQTGKTRGEIDVKIYEIISLSTFDSVSCVLSVKQYFQEN